MILISKTFAVITDESAEQGDFADRGFVFEDVPHTFRELVGLINGGFESASCFPATGGTREWLTSEPDEDIVTGDSRIESIHYSHHNKPRAAKYWRLAFIVGGVIK